MYMLLWDALSREKSTTLEEVKSYIKENDVYALDIKRLSVEEWNSQYFYISILFKEKQKCVNQTFGHKTFAIGVSISREEQRNKTLIGGGGSCGILSEMWRDYIRNFLDRTSCAVLCLQ